MNFGPLLAKYNKSPLRIGNPATEPDLEREGGVTVCIALTCMNELDVSRKSIVLCTDWLWSGELGSVEAAFKIQVLDKGWVCLFSGSLPDINGALVFLKKAFRYESVIDKVTIIPTIQGALADYKRQKADSYTIAKFGMKYSDFLDVAEKFHPNILEESQTNIMSIGINADFLIAGFHNGDPIICVTDGIDRPTIANDFAIIGTGARLAASMVQHRKHNEGISASQALYHAWEAKKYSEGNTTVGKETSIFVMSDGVPFFIPKDKDIATLDRLYARHGPNPLKRLPVFEGLSHPGRK